MVEVKAVEGETGERTVWESAWINAEDKRVRSEQDEVINLEFHCPYRWRWFCSRKVNLSWESKFPIERKCWNEIAWLIYFIDRSMIG